MKTLKLLTIVMILLSFSCKKKKIEPQSVCNYATTGDLVGTYKSSTIKGDTIVISFLKDNCPINNYTYKIKNIDIAMANYPGAAILGDNPTTKDDYEIIYNDTDLYGESSVLKIRKLTYGIEVSSLMTNNTFSPYLKFNKIN